jgi:hypothetical protein
LSKESFLTRKPAVKTVKWHQFGDGSAEHLRWFRAIVSPWTPA